MKKRLAPRMLHSVCRGAAQGGGRPAGQARGGASRCSQQRADDPLAQQPDHGDTAALWRRRGARPAGQPVQLPHRRCGTATSWAHRRVSDQRRAGSGGRSRAHGAGHEHTSTAAGTKHLSHGNRAWRLGQRAGFRRRARLSRHLGCASAEQRGRQQWGTEARPLPQQLLCDPFRRRGRQQRSRPPASIQPPQLCRRRPEPGIDCCCRAGSRKHSSRCDHACDGKQRGASRRRRRGGIDACRTQWHGWLALGQRIGGADVQNDGRFGGQYAGKGHDQRSMTSRARVCSLDNLWSAPGPFRCSCLGLGASCCCAIAPAAECRTFKWFTDSTLFYAPPLTAPCDYAGWHS
jgi:hypothetical protein